MPHAWHHRVVSELDRLRQQGAAKLAEAERAEREREDADARERTERDEAHVRLAIGRYRRRTARRLVFMGSLPGLGLFALTMIAAVMERFTEIWIVALFASLAWLFGGMWLWGSELIWRASPAAMRDERRWVTSRPFHVTGYFEWLRASEGRSAHLRLEIRGAGLEETREDLRTLLAAVHPEVSCDGAPRRDGAAHLLLTNIPARDDDQRAHVVHEIIDRVLVPLHQESPIAGVALSE